jgi:hypothetical protein
MIQDESFHECDACRTEPGTPWLCDGCLHNRALIAELRSRVEQLQQAKQAAIDLLRLLWKNAGRSRGHPGGALRDEGR